MNVCLVFFNLGGYHLARIEAAKKSCDERGWKFEVIEITRSTSEHPWGTLELPDYVTTLVPYQPGDAPSLPDLSLLENHLNQSQPDVIAIPGWGHNFARAALQWCRKNARIPVLMSESKYDDAPRVWWKELIKRSFYVRHFSSAIVGGEKHRHYLNRLGMPDTKIFAGYDVVGNDYFIDQVDEHRRRAAPSAPDCVDGRRFFLSANRFIERKNLATLIHAFAQFTESHSSADTWDLVLLGDGPQNQALQALADSLGLSARVHFPGFQTYSEISEWYAFADAFIHPANAEQWGLVVNEAMAAELPILLSQSCGCYPDLMLEGTNGFSFAPHRIDELTAGMTAIAADESLRERMGRASRQHIQNNYSPLRFGAGLVSAIDAAAGSALNAA